MQSLRIERYRPYLIDGTYVFTTDNGRVYSVTFEEQSFFTNDEYAFAAKTYELFLTLEKSPPSYATAPRIGATLVTIIRHFVEIDPLRLVCFTCDTADGRYLARFKRFSENNNGYLLPETGRQCYISGHQQIISDHLNFAQR